MLHIQPERCLIDEKISVKVTRCNPFEQLTIRCEVVEKNFVYESFGYFIASSTGIVDLSSNPSFGGSYIGIDQMGLFWSMLPAKGEKIGIRYLVQNVMKPQIYKIQVYKNHVPEENFQRSLRKSNSSSSEVPILEQDVLRCFCSDGVTREEVNNDGVLGFIFKPPGKGPFKGVIDIYGGAGGINENRAALLASHGFVAFTLPHHRYKSLPREFFDVHLEYFLKAIDYFSSLDFVLPGIGLIGLSSGGTLGLLLSTMTTKISAVVAISTNSYMSFMVKYKGEVFPNLDDLYLNLDIPFREHENGGILVDMHCYDHRTDKVTINVENSSAQYLIIAGKDDLMVNQEVVVSKLLRRMKEHGQLERIKVISYPGAGHFIDPPYIPQTLLHYSPNYKAVVAVGGKKVENAAACIHSWEAMLAFVNDNTGRLKLNSKL